MSSAAWRKADSTIRFDAGLDRYETGSWTALVLPRSASARLPSPGALVAEGTINGFPFRASLDPDGQGNHSLRVNEALQAAARASAGDSVSVEITRIGDEPECRVPADLREALAKDPSADALWSEITPLARRDWILWISSARQPTTRRGRIEKARSMLAAGKRRVCCFGGLAWLTKDHPATGGSWIELPSTRAPRSAKASR